MLQVVSKCRDGDRYRDRDAETGTGRQGGREAGGREAGRQGGRDREAGTGTGTGNPAVAEDWCCRHQAVGCPPGAARPRAPHSILSYPILCHSILNLVYDIMLYYTMLCCYDYYYYHYYYIIQYYDMICYAML